MAPIPAPATFDPDLSIAVLGAGIGGLAASIALRQAGFRRIDLFEQAEALQPVGAGISLWANAIAALEHLGLGDALDGLGWAGTSSTLRTADGRPLSGTLSDRFTERLGRRELLRTVLRSDLQAALLARLGGRRP